MRNTGIIIPILLCWLLGCEQPRPQGKEAISPPSYAQLAQLTFPADSAFVVWDDSAHRLVSLAHVAARYDHAAFWELREAYVTPKPPFSRPLALTEKSDSMRRRLSIQHAQVVYDALESQTRDMSGKHASIDLCDGIAQIILPIDTLLTNAEGNLCLVKVLLPPQSDHWSSCQVELLSRGPTRCHRQLLVQQVDALQASWGKALYSESMGQELVLVFIHANPGGVSHIDLRVFMRNGA